MERPEKFREYVAMLHSLCLINRLKTAVLMHAFKIDEDLACDCFDWLIKLCEIEELED